MSGTVSAPVSDADLPVPPGQTVAAAPTDATTAANATTVAAKATTANTAVAQNDAQVARSVGTQKAQDTATDTQQAAASQGVLVDEGPDSLYTFTFLSLTGDRYRGVFYDDSADYHAGQWFASPYGQQYGYYVIEKEFEFPVDIGIKEGTVFLTEYYDAQTNTNVQPFRIQNGQPSTRNGLGYEYDFALVGGQFGDFGFGGTNLIG